MQDFLLVFENDYKILVKLIILTKSFQSPEETQWFQFIITGEVHNDGGAYVG